MSLDGPSRLRRDLMGPSGIGEMCRNGSRDLSALDLSRGCRTAGSLRRGALIVLRWWETTEDSGKYRHIVLEQRSSINLNQRRVFGVRSTPGRHRMEGGVLKDTRSSSGGGSDTAWKTPIPPGHLRSVPLPPTPTNCCRHQTPPNAARDVPGEPRTPDGFLSRFVFGLLSP